MSAGLIAFGLLASHAFCDFSAQSDAMAKGKNRHHRTTPPLGAIYQPTWFYWLPAHGLIHGAGVAAALAIGGRPDLWWLGCLEALAHVCIDFGKCENWYGINTDQGAHLLCKGLWFIAAETA